LLIFDFESVAYVRLRGRQVRGAGLHGRQGTGVSVTLSAGFL